MISSFLEVGSQVLVLFIIMAIGFLFNKINLLSEKAVKGITDLVLYAVTPCVIINSFQRKFEVNILRNLIIAFVAAISIFVISILIAEILYRKADADRGAVLKFVVVFSNCGFMALPLQESILGADGVFFGAAFVAIFNIFSWTYGLCIMSGVRDIKGMLKAAVNPGVIGTVIAILLYVFKISLPAVILSPISFMAALNTPLPMIVIGFYLASANYKKAFTDISSYIAVFLRLIVIPLFAFFVLYIIGVKGTLLTSIIIAVSAPVAVSTTMFASKFNRDTELSVSVVTVSTIFSIVTMPLIVGLTQYLGV